MKEEEITEGHKDSYRADEYIHHLTIFTVLILMLSCTYFMVSIYGLLYVNSASVNPF